MADNIESSVVLESKSSGKQIMTNCDLCRFQSPSDRIVWILDKSIEKPAVSDVNGESCPKRSNFLQCSIECVLRASKQIAGWAEACCEHTRKTVVPSHYPPPKTKGRSQISTLINITPTVSANN
jgi:hypothetical protein